MHKSGFVNIIGNPNVGKSTLINAIIDEPLSIVSSKPQTTRHRILGFYNDEDSQIIFSDTPGILEPKYSLQKWMMKYVQESFVDADVIIYMVSIQEKIDESIIEKIKTINKPTFLLINKVDLVNQESAVETIEKYLNFNTFEQVLAISAQFDFNPKNFIETIKNHLPDHPPYYDKETLSDRPMRFFVSEIIRQSIFELFQKEIPYSSEVECVEFKNLKDKILVKSIVYVEKETQKMIILGKGGQAIKNLGITARVALEKYLNKKVRLEISIKVSSEWRRDEGKLKKFGYISEK